MQARDGGEPRLNALLFDLEVAEIVKEVGHVIRKLSVLILAATLLAGCFGYDSYPRQETTTTTTTTCPSGTQLQSDGRCR
jgi:hypothetical protein